MPRRRRPGAIKGSPEWRQRISDGKKHANRRKAEAAIVRPAHIREWLDSGIVHTSMRSMIDFYSDQIVDMTQDMGGEGEVSAMERALLGSYLRVAVAGDVEWQRLLKNPNDGVPEKLTTCLNTARATLLALGLKRRAKDVNQSLAEIITIKAQAAQDADEAACAPLSSTNASESAPAPCPVNDGGTGEEPAP